MIEISDLERKAALVRKWCLVSTTEAGSGHPTSCLSAADLMTVLFNNFFSYDIKNPENPNNDKLIFSKGHAAPLFYTLFALSGGFPLEKLKTLRKFGSELEGHPTPNFQYTVAATGSLGQGLSVGAGTALSAKKDNLFYKTFVLLGDGEMAEGNVWEAANFASFYKLNNLIAIIDVNRLGQSQETMFGIHSEEYEKRFKAFGWEAVVVNGHNFEEIEKAFKIVLAGPAARSSQGAPASLAKAANADALLGSPPLASPALKSLKSEKPFVIIAKTVKGKGVSFLEDKDGWHGKALKKEELEKALEELERIDDNLRFDLKTPQKTANSVGDSSSLALNRGTKRNPIQNNAEEQVKLNSVSPVLRSSAFEYKPGEEVATREAFGQALAELGNENSLIYSLDGDTKNSTFAGNFKRAHPDRFIECFIAEQNMAGVALGLSKTGKIPFVSTFAAFLTRAFDQIRMAAISKANIKFVGSHAGVSIGEDGPSQMGIEDFAMFGAIPDSVIFHPCDAVSITKMIPLMASENGIFYLRTLRPKTPVIYDGNENFSVGGSKTLRSSQDDILTVTACGVTVFEALRAYETLKKEGISIRIVDCYSIKPIDKKGLIESLKSTREKIIIAVEDHYKYGGLGNFVLSALADQNAQIEKMAVNKLPKSGTKDELLEFEEISAKHITNKVKSLIK